MRLTAIELCKNREVRSAATYFFHATGIGIWKYNNTFYTEKEFEEAFPVNAISVKPQSLKGENSDHSKRWMTSFLIILCLLIYKTSFSQFTYNETLAGAGMSVGYSSMGCLIGEGWGGLQFNEKLFTGLGMKVHSKSSNTDYPVIIESRSGYMITGGLELYGGVGYHTSSTDGVKKHKQKSFKIASGIIYHFRENPLIISAGMSGSIYTIQIGIFGVK